MKLIKAQIKNFRSIKEAEISFEPRLRTLVGVNEAGKSNILAALALLDSTRVVEPWDLREPHPDELTNEEAYVRFVFRFDASEKDEINKNALSKCFPSNLPLMIVDGKEYTAGSMVQLFSQGLYIVQIRDGARIYTRWRISAQSIKDGWMVKKVGAVLPEPLLLKDGQKLHHSSLIELIHVSLLKEDAKDLFETATNERVEGVWDAPVNALIKKKCPSCMYWSYSESNLLPSQIPVSAFCSNPSAYLPLKEMFELAGLPNVESAFSEYEKRPHGRRNLLERVSLAATKHLKASWPECKGIQIALSPNGDFIDAAIKDKHNQYAFDKRSDGFKRFITFLLLVSAKIKNGTFENVMFLQDEPDLGLHPSGVKHLLASLISLSEKNYAVVATHSIFLVDKERVDRHLIVKKDDEKTSVHEVEASNISDEEVIYNALGYSLYDNLKPKNIIFEGWRDKKLFQVSLTKRGGNFSKLKEAISSSVGLCHAKGLKDIPRISTFLQLAGRKGMAVIDSDEPAHKMQRTEQDGHVIWHRYDELLGVKKNLTAEDFINQAKLRSTLGVVSRNNGVVVAPPANLFSGESSVKFAESWLKELGFGGDEVKRALNEWKSEIFDDLKNTDIINDYENVQKGIEDRLNAWDSK